MYQLKRTQFIKADMATAWNFFSSPKNLQVITPAYLGFEIKTELPEKMYPGLFINYKVSPLLGIKLNWTTEITHVNEPHFFVDEQRVGPYAIWHHEHHFVQKEDGVEMTDIVSYALPFGFLGRLVQPFLVAPKLNEIFAYRFKKVDELFA
jgi:ligand-binding SRPBCC domain-containing protein